MLDTTKTALDAAPKVDKNAFVVSGEVGSESQKVDAYWKGKPTGQSGQLKGHSSGDFGRLIITPLGVGRRGFSLTFCAAERGQ